MLTLVFSLLAPVVLAPILCPEGLDATTPAELSGYLSGDEDIIIIVESNLESCPFRITLL